MPASFDRCPVCGIHHTLPDTGDCEYFREWVQQDQAKPERITRDRLGIELARVYSRRSTCVRAQVGAVICSVARPISAGYCGAPSGQPHCGDAGCVIGTHGGCTRTVHAEVNAISFAARYGTATNNCTLYTTLSPCSECAKLIINAGIIRVVYADRYRDDAGIRLLEASGVTVEGIV